MIKQKTTAKILSLLVALTIAGVNIFPAFAKTAAKANLLAGIIPTASTTDSWLLANRPLSNLTDGSGTTLTNDNNAWAAPCTLSNVSGKSYSWCQFDFSAAAKLNKVIIQQKAEMSQSKDIAIDVLLSSGGWKRVGLKYNIADTYHAISFTFSPINALALRVTFGSARTGKGGTDIAEIEGYYDDTLTEYEELQTPDNPDFEIEDTFASLNLLRGLKATSSNTNSWFDDNRPVSLLTDGSGTSYSIGWAAEYKNAASVTASAGSRFAWVSFELPQAKNVNKIIIQQRQNSSDFPQTKDFAIDVLLEDGTWKRVASSYETAFNFSGFYMTFEYVKAKEIKITGRTDCLHINEIEAYYDPDIKDYTGIKEPQDLSNLIPTVSDMTNILKGMKGISSNNDAWFREFRPIEWATDGESGAYASPASITNAGSTDFAWVKFDFETPQEVNKVVVQQHAYIEKVFSVVKDMAVDVLLENGEWKRVAAEYNISNPDNAVVFTFEPEKIKSLKITSSGRRTQAKAIHISEIEAYNDKTVISYSGVKKADNPNYSVPTKEDTTNLLYGIKGESSNKDEWFEQFRPIDWTTDGVNGAEEPPASITNAGATDYAWVIYNFEKATEVNTVTVQQRAYLEKVFSVVKDLAVDVLLENGEWKRVAAEYNIDNTSKATVFTFKPVKVKAIKITGNGRRTKAAAIHIVEVEAYNDKTVTEYSGVKAADNMNYSVPTTADMTNLLYGIKGKSSNHDSWFGEFRPIEWTTDGISGSEQAPSSITNAGTTDYAWIIYNFKKVTEVNTVTVQQRAYLEKVFGVVKDLAVDVLLENGEWKRVAAEYNIDNTSKANVFTFKPVKVKAIKIVSNGRRTNASVIHIVEVEAYNDKTVTEYSGIKQPDNVNYKVPSLSDMTNLLIGAKASSSNTDQWFEMFRPVSWANDGISGPTAPTSTVNISGKSKSAWIQFDFNTPTLVNTVGIQQREYLKNVFSVINDFALDVRLSDGSWKRVAAEYNISDTGRPIRLTFEPVKVTAIRIIAGSIRNNVGALNATEIEAFYDTCVGTYSGIKEPDNEKYRIPATKTHVAPKPKFDNLSKSPKGPYIPKS